MELHAFPSCTITQDISVEEVKPHFSVYLSKDFTAQIGGYISSNWNYIFFRTRYGTQSSIRIEPLSLNHIDTYTLSPINMNCTILEIDDKDMAQEPTTSLAEVSDYLFDE